MSVLAASAKDALRGAWRAYSRLTARYGFFGDYASWEEARRRAGGYDAPAIRERVRAAALEVKEGRAVFERDSVLFDRVEYSYPVTAALLWSAVANGGRLRVMDVGGALGSHYFQNRAFLQDVRDLSWNVVEQEELAEIGRREFEDGRLRFFSDAETCVRQARPDVALLSTVVQYLPDPHGFLDRLASWGVPRLVFDRTPFVKGPDRLTVQRVPPNIYKASYPAWFFNEERFMGHFSRAYRLVASFKSPEEVNLPSEFKGFVFARKERVG